MRSVPSLLLGLVLVLAATPAAAGGPPGMTAPEEPPTTRTQRYGMRIFLADLAWIGAAMVVGQLEESRSDGGDGNGLGSVVGLGYFVAAPATHLAHGNRTGALQSLGARALLPVGGAIAGMALAGNSSDGSDEDGGAVLVGMILGATAGVITAMVLDYSVFAKKEVAVPRDSYLGKASLRPGVKISGEGFAVSLAGSF